MILRIVAVGLAGLTVAGAATLVAGAGLAAVACAARRRAEARTAWPAEDLDEVPPATGRE
ncbi:hypothetical protein GWK16_10650 [Roseomonas sp. JC162]|uniref:Uncharacterized protein n=1 Tax=Neoroseomonas marina TaxID=1232220 RepID=A0A848EC62_9PROT|nr:hypothetical protein [Neoroseomonas marina]NMJ41702.1 hypothetical protein [Neoroseomonas marina]